MKTVTILGNNYEIGKMPPREQFHVLRRLSPIMTAVGGAALGLLDGSKSKEEVMGDMLMSLGPLTDVLSGMKDEELDYVLNACLLRVKRQDARAGTWHPTHIMIGRNELKSMFADIELNNELQLVAEVIKANLSGFFGPLSDGTASSPSAPSATAALSATKR